MKNIIEIQNLSKSFGDFIAVDDINFQVKEGDLFAFLGTNGAGKSTTISMICSLIEKTSGKIIIDGYNMDKDIDKIRGLLGIVFQNNVLDDLLTVKENLSIRAKFYGFYGQKLITCLNELKMIFELDDIWNRQFGKLSGGQKRKCEIARSVLHKPKILILDEPTTGLDPKTRANIWTLIKNMQKEYGMTVFLTTHYMEEAAIADYVVIIKKGKILAEGTPDELKNIYGKDTLKLQFQNQNEGINSLKTLGYLPMRKGDFIAIYIKGSFEALTILNTIKGISDFEFIKGSMDDVFLEVTKDKGVIK